MAQNDPQVNFRCPGGIKASLEVAAKANGRSLNAEIVHRLGQSLEVDESVSIVEPETTIVAVKAADLKRYVKEAFAEMQRGEVPKPGRRKPNKPSL